MDFQADQDRQLKALQQQLAASHAERTAAMEARVRAEQQVCAFRPACHNTAPPSSFVSCNVIVDAVLPCMTIRKQTSPQLASTTRQIARHVSSEI